VRFLRTGTRSLRAQDQRILTEDDVQAVLQEAKQTLSTVFGNEENRQVGITGDVRFVGIDGATVKLEFSGQFWHQRSTVLQRLDKFIRDRIPECMEVVAEENDLNTTERTERFFL
jgi:hypothetical protein